MKENGLLVKPEFSNIEIYLQSGNRTEITEEIKKVSDRINADTDGMLVRNMLVWINQHTRRLHNENDDRKFKRTATEIIQSKERTGCCDSSTLFTALVRNRGIPTMQIITLNKEWAKRVNKGEKLGTWGHYFTACYLRDIAGKENWTLIDSDQPAQDIRDVRLSLLNLEDRNIGRNYYAFAYTRDYSDINFHGLRIDCIENMIRMQREAYKMCDKEDIQRESEKER